MQETHGFPLRHHDLVPWTSTAWPEQKLGEPVGKKLISGKLEKKTIIYTIYIYIYIIYNISIYINIYIYICMYHYYYYYVVLSKRLKRWSFRYQISRGFQWLSQQKPLSVAGRLIGLVGRIPPPAGSCRLVGTMPQHQKPPINRPKSRLSYLIVSYSRFDLNMGMAQKRGASEPTKLLVVCIRPAISWVSINFDGGITKKIWIGNFTGRPADGVSLLCLTLNSSSIYMSWLHVFYSCASSRWNKNVIFSYKHQ